MAPSAELLDFLAEQMSAFGPVTRKRMFGGAGFFRNDRMFALVAGDVLYFKADAITAPQFDAGNLPAFGYATKRGVHTLTSYRRAPEACLEDADVMAQWCRLAWEAALRSAGSGRRKR